jgi:hypothetical protein
MGLEGVDGIILRDHRPPGGIGDCEVGLVD